MDFLSLQTCSRMFMNNFLYTILVPRNHQAVFHKFLAPLHLEKTHIKNKQKKRGRITFPSLNLLTLNR
jgi:hypothetical protein